MWREMNHGPQAAPLPADPDHPAPTPPATDELALAY